MSLNNIEIQMLIRCQSTMVQKSKTGAKNHYQSVTQVWEVDPNYKIFENNYIIIINLNNLSSQQYRVKLFKALLLVHCEVPDYFHLFLI